MSASASERIHFRRQSRRPRLATFGALTLAAFLTLAYVAREQFHDTQAYQARFGTPVELTEHNTPVVKIGRITPIEGAESAAIRQAPTQNSPEIMSIRFANDVQMIEVLGNQYPSPDDRGKKHTVPGSSREYGQWFQTAISADTAGYVSGNVVTVTGVR